RAAAALRLEARWRALGEAQGAPGGWACAAEALPALERAVNGAPENAALWLLLAEARLQRDLPQGAVEAAGEALGRLGEGPGTAANARLEGRARYVRGLGHWRLGQPALAEADLDAALREGPAESAAPDEERVRRLRARGAVRLLRRNVDGMCEDLSAACALGDCEGLAVARGRGHCRAGAGASGTSGAFGGAP
ncbi:MAG: translation initiation factor IF-2, partial [Desulfovibrio sp.]|nr:translation initiation factor IF-2 [Desulfovibrio sp.]